MKRITNYELLHLPLGSMIKVIWHNSPRHEKNAEYHGVIYGNKIGWEDGSTEDIVVIAEAMYNDWCICYQFIE